MRPHLNALHVRASVSKMPSRRTSTLSLRMAVRQSATPNPTIIRFWRPPAVARLQNSIDPQAFSVPQLILHTRISIPGKTGEKSSTRRCRSVAGRPGRAQRLCAPEPSHLDALYLSWREGPGALPQPHNRIACCSSSSAFSSSRRPVRALPASVLINASAIGSIP